MYYEYEAEICRTCNGSGEGYTDGSTCRACKGSGEMLTDESAEDLEHERELAAEARLEDRWVDEHYDD